MLYFCITFYFHCHCHCVSRVWRDFFLCIIIIIIIIVHHLRAQDKTNDVFIKDLIKSYSRNMWDSRWWRNVHRQLIVCRETWKVPPRKFRACPDCDVIDDAVTWFCGLSICSLQFCLLFWHSMHSKHKVLWLDTIGWVLDKTFHLLQYHCSSLKRFFWTFGVQLT